MLRTRVWIVILALPVAVTTLVGLMVVSSPAQAQSGQKLKPGKVTGLRAVASASDGAVSLSWDAPAAGAPVTGYRILRRIPGSERRLSALIDISGRADTRHTDTTVQRRTEYIYRVQALNGEVAGEMSARVKVRVPRPLKPGKPTGLVATWYGESDPQSHLVRLVWRAPTDGGRVTGYRIFRRAPDLGERQFVIQNKNTRKTETIFDDVHSMRYGTRFIYRIQSLNGEEPGGMSEPVEFTTPSLLTVRNLAASAAPDGTVTLTWDAPARSVTGYRIWRRAPDSEARLSILVSNTKSASTTHNDRTTQSGTKYIYRVQALKGDGREGAISRPVRVTTAAVFEKLGRVSSPDGHDAGPGLNIIAWDYYLDFKVSGYRILRSESGGDAVVLAVMRTTRKLGPTYSDRNVRSGITYTYWVQVISGDRIGPKSEPITIIAE